MNSPLPTSVEPTPALAQEKDSECLLGLEVKVLLSDEELRGVLVSEELARVDVNPILWRPGACKRFIWKLVSLAKVLVPLDAKRSVSSSKPGASTRDAFVRCAATQKTMRAHAKTRSSEVTELRRHVRSLVR